MHYTRLARESRSSRAAVLVSSPLLIASYRARACLHKSYACVVNDWLNSCDLRVVDARGGAQQGISRNPKTKSAPAPDPHWPAVLAVIPGCEGAHEDAPRAAQRLRKYFDPGIGRPPTL